MKALAHIRSLIPLKVGTLASPSYPAGRRAIFYRDKTGQHRPVHLRKSEKTANDQVLAFLARPQYFRNLLDTHQDIDGRANIDVNALPGSIKTELFPEFKLAFVELVALGVREVVWDDSGVYSLQVVRERDSGTYRMSKTHDHFIERPATDSQPEQTEVSQRSSAGVEADLAYAPPA